jgi:hypothetical protein
MKLSNAIILIEYIGKQIFAIHAFSHDDEGREEAEAMFKKIAAEQTEDNSDTRLFSDAQVEEGWKEGWIMSDNACGNEGWTLSEHSAEA